MGSRKALLELSPNTTRKPRDSKEWERRKRPSRTHLAAVSAKYRSAGTTIAGDLISSDLTLKIKLIY